MRFILKHIIQWHDLLLLQFFHEFSRSNVEKNEPAHGAYRIMAGDATGSD